MNLKYKTTILAFMCEYENFESKTICKNIEIRCVERQRFQCEQGFMTYIVRGTVTRTMYDVHM